MKDSTLRIFDSLSEDVKQGLTETFDNRHGTMEKCGVEMKNAISAIRKRGWKTHEVIWNSALFANTIALDLSHFVIDLVYTRNDTKRRLFARSAALLVYEIGEDVPSVFGRDFRNSYATLNVPNSLIADLGRETKKFASRWKEEKKTLKPIRDIGAAHRDHDAAALTELIDNLDVFELITVSTHFGGMLNDLGKASQEIITFTSTVKPPELVSHSLKPPRRNG